jgi:predicted ATP-grasp superfamily ATP-dependent carboligase
MTLSVLIPDGEHDTSFKVMTCLAQVPKTKIHVVSNREVTRTRYSRFCESFRCREDSGEQEWFDEIRSVAEHHDVDVILPGSELGTRFVCGWSDRLRQVAGLPPLPQVSVFDTAVDKGSLADFLREHDLPTPNTVPAAAALDSELAFPVLIKPKRSYSGIGIQLFQDKRALENFVTAHRDAIDTYIVQEYVVGADVGCNVLCKQGETLVQTIQKPIVPHPRPFAFSLCIRFIECDKTLQTVSELMSALAWSGVANIDLKYSQARGRVEILDVNPRYWGTLIGSLTAGVNFPYLACLSALNRPWPKIDYRVQSCFMEIGNAIKESLNKVKGNGGVIPDFFRETNLRFILRDPLPFLNRSIVRQSPRAPGTPAHV